MGNSIKISTYKLILIIIYFLINGLLISCQHNPDQIARPANMHKQLHYTKKFIITSYIRNNEKLDPTQPIFAYVEGDGQAWRSRYCLSENPTPRDPLTLRLSIIDHNPNVIYIARPCQYTPLSLDQNCQNIYWSKARYSKAVVDSINEVLDNFKNIIIKKYHNNKKFDKNLLKIHLIGYSGGATIVELIAIQRKDLLSIRTIAGNLDHDAVSDFHQTTKLSDSLNPINFINKINHIPQLHYLGKKDQIIPENIVKNFNDTVNNSNPLKHCSNYQIIEKFDHYHGWEKFWKQAVNIIPSCRNHTYEIK